MSKEDGSGKLQSDHADVLPNPKFYPGITAYGHYRLGVAAASMPQKDDNSSANPYGPVGEHPISAAYTDEDQKILDMAAKRCGIEIQKLGSSHSTEPDTTHKHSPVNHNSGHHNHLSTDHRKK